MLRQIARFRVTTGFIAGAVVLWLARPTLRSLIGGVIVAVFGEAVRFWAAGHLEKGREVTTTGPYAFMRHPLYVGSTIIGVGLAVASASLVVALLVLGYLAITLTAAITTEEAHLTDKFGPAYPEYREGRAVKERRRFSFARALRNREHRAVAGLLLVIAVLVWKSRL